MKTRDTLQVTMRGTQMWKLAKFLQAELESYGIEVTNTRPQITDNPKLELRGRLAVRS